MNRFKRATVVAGIMVGALYHNFRKNPARMNEEIFRGFTMLGGVYVKFLQIMSLKSQFFGSWSTEESLAVYDDVRPDELDIEEVLAKEFTQKQRQQLLRVDPYPFAAGSFGQVYYGQHIDGTPVIIKVLRPSLVSTIKFDLKVLRMVVSMLRLTNSKVKIDISSLYKDFKKVILAEIDYKTEVKNAQYFYEYFKDKPNVVIPKTYTDLSSSNIIVQEYIGGIPMTELIALKDRGQNPFEVTRQKVGSDLENALRLLGEELLICTLLADHLPGDPHPGNLKVLSEDRIGIYDFGITGTPPENRQAFLEVVKDYMDLLNNKVDPGKIFIDGLRFFANDLYRAINTVGRSLAVDANMNFTEELKKLAVKAYEQNKSRVDFDFLVSEGQLANLMNYTVNENNRFAITVQFDSSVMIRSADAYMTILHALGIRVKLMPKIFSNVVDRLKKERINLPGKSETMSMDRAVDIIGDWMQQLIERDPVLFRSLIAKMNRVPKRSKDE